MDIGAVITTIAIAGLIGVMIAMGSTLQVTDFRRVLTQPRALLLGVAGQILLLPAVAASIAIILDLSPALSVGLVVISACPGGAPSNAVCAISKGDVALSVTLTAISSLAAFLTVPLLVGAAIDQFLGEDTRLQLPFWSTAARIFLTTFLPVVTGMALARWVPMVAEAIRRPLFIGGFGIVLITSLLFVFSMIELLTSIEALLAVVMLNVLMMSLAFALGRGLGLTEQETRSVTVEVGMQNISMAIVVIIGILNAPELLAPTFFYLPMAYVTGLGFAWLVRRYRSPVLA
ncbi:bile acid:sodium symporter family protein [Leisingera sp. M658]|uniref:bile acid:sodium symporter family protein n=1 Tax=Leisingera sp. M658 TaxID=2867015 RepID=UPI0021A74647|nr:bile acid:sodium symporter family protein [Leisingera sp. M658]UWQ75695.1 bile acid:sodium symporter family protein [Leisingera sp. M658]